MNTGASQFETKCLQVLKSSGARITEARKAVIRVLSKSQTPMSPKEILSEIHDSRSLTDVDPVSVYRVLEKLMELDLIHQVNPGGYYIGCEHIECEAQFHILTRCTHCGSTEELDTPSESIAPLLRFLTKKFEFEPLKHHFQIDGICKLCKK